MKQSMRRFSPLQFAVLNDVLAELGNSRNGNNVAFITSVMTSLAETTIDFVLKDPANENEIIDMAFRMF
jgi:hypothetical protein